MATTEDTEKEVIGYKCLKCDRKFMLTNYKNRSDAFKDAYIHNREAHRSVNDINRIRE